MKRNDHSNNNNINQQPQQQEDVKKVKHEQQQQQQQLTVSSLINDSITPISTKYWLKGYKEELYDANIVESIFNDEIISSNIDTRKLMLLELSHYLESYLWPNFIREGIDQNANRNDSHVWSIILMVNEKARESLSPFDVMHNSSSSKEGDNKQQEQQKYFKIFFDRVLQIGETLDMTSISGIKLATHYILFLINCFASLEDAMVRNECLKIVSYPMWTHVSSGRLDQELLDLSPPALVKKIRLLKKKNESTTYSSFLINLMNRFIKLLNQLQVETPSESESSSTALELYKNKIYYCERFLEFMIDLVNQVTTRRFFYVVIDDFHLLVKIKESLFSKHSIDAKTINESTKLLEFYLNIDINNFTGEELSNDVIISNHYFKIQNLQRLAFKEFPNELKELALANVSQVESKENLLRWFGSLELPRLKELCIKLNLIDKSAATDSNSTSITKEYLISILLFSYRRRSHRDRLLNDPMYPTEVELFQQQDKKNNSPSSFLSDNQLFGDYKGERSLSLPKLGLQYLSFNDYLYRNYYLFKMETIYELRSHIEDAVRRCSPKKDGNKTVFGGWSRMTLPIHSFRILKVGTPNIGEVIPKSVTANVTVTLANIKNHELQKEWDSIKEHDVLFLVNVVANGNNGYEIKYVRGCQVIVLTDDKGERIEQHQQQQENGSKKRPVSLIRHIKVDLDCNQYQIDQDAGTINDVYSSTNSFNLLVRRNAKENNFKAVLETITGLIKDNQQQQQVEGEDEKEKATGKANLPDWLSSTFLGYPQDSIDNNDNPNVSIKLNDTFLTKDHVLKSFNLNNKNIDIDKCIQPPFKLTYQRKEQGDDQGKEQLISIESYKDIHLGEKQNRVEFTPTQVQAIIKGTREGLTLIQGPPGTGKTDVAVQIISNIYHNYPNQRTLIITHSNQALNQLFEKIYRLDIDERYLLRLGHGQKQLKLNGNDSSEAPDFTKNGRIEYMINLRQNRLQLVDYLAKSIKVTSDVGYTCETSNHFYQHHIEPMWKKYLAQIEQTEASKKEKFIVDNFPFPEYFSVTSTKIFYKSPDSQDLASLEQLMERIERMWMGIKLVFTELEECRIFELLKSSNDRFNYLLLKQSRVVAMTCTHASLKRSELVRLGFKFDNILMEEAAQISDIESFIPLQLQSTQFSEKNRLKRLIMIGDHQQLPPIVQNSALAKFSHLDQSLFARLVRLGVSYTTLDRQGRSRSQISQLYKWRYKNLQDLQIIKDKESDIDHNQTKPSNNNDLSQEFSLANPGFLYESQIIGVEEGQEYEPTPHFYQNLEEAEYLVATYQYMRLIGYPANKITMLTTYNGQKALLRNIVKEKCTHNPLFGEPYKITTVDKFQGQQSDYVLLSLVRTRHFGHIRDLRRLIVAMSRARLGLYIFCKESYFRDCYETTAIFSRFKQQTTKLQLVPGETYRPYPNFKRPALPNTLTTPYSQLKENKELFQNDIFEIENQSHMYQLVQSNLP